MPRALLLLEVPLFLSWPYNQSTKPNRIKRRSSFADHLKSKHGINADGVYIDACAPPLSPLAKQRRPRGKTLKLITDTTITEEKALDDNSGMFWIMDNARLTYAFNTFRVIVCVFRDCVACGSLDTVQLVAGYPSSAVFRGFLWNQTFKCFGFSGRRSNPRTISPAFRMASFPFFNWRKV